jgi:capsular polysaccharide transport system permease protein
MKQRIRAMTMNAPHISAGRTHLVRELRLASRTLFALLMREIISRYGRTNISFLWLIVEPLILCIGVMIVWTFIHHNSHGVPLITFIVSGYMPLTLWRHISSHAVTCIRQNTPLFYHPSVRPLDVLFACTILEFLGTSMALLAVLTTLRFCGLIDPIARLDLALAGWLFMAWLSFSIGMLMCALAERFDFVEKLVSPFQYLMLPISGCFFMVGWLPTWTQTLALYVPTVHCYEMFRAGLLGESVETHFSFAFLATVCTVATAGGLTLLRGAAQHIQFE